MKLHQLFYCPKCKESVKPVRDLENEDEEENCSGCCNDYYENYLGITYHSCGNYSGSGCLKC